MWIRTLLVTLSLYLTSALVVAQTPEPSKDADGLIHITLTLDRKAISIDYPPNLSNADASHQQLLSGVAGTRTHVGTLTAHRALRLGSLATDPEAPLPPREAGEPAPEPPTHELWLVRNAEGWELEAHQSDSTTVNIVPLSHDESNSGGDQPFLHHSTPLPRKQATLNYGGDVTHGRRHFASTSCHHPQDGPEFQEIQVKTNTTQIPVRSLVE